MREVRGDSVVGQVQANRRIQNNSSVQQRCEKCTNCQTWRCRGSTPVSWEIRRWRYRRQVIAKSEWLNSEMTPGLTMVEMDTEKSARTLLHYQISKSLLNCCFKELRLLWKQNKIATGSEVHKKEHRLSMFLLIYPLLILQFLMVPFSFWLFLFKKEFPLKFSSDWENL